MSTARFAVLLLTFAPVFGSAAELKLDGWTARIVPEELAVYARLAGSADEILVARGRHHSVSDIVAGADGISLRIPGSGVGVHFSRRGDRLIARFDASADTDFEWPITGDDPKLSGLILPEGEGLYLPRADVAWTRRITNQCDHLSGGLSMPFWGFSVGARTLSYQVSPEPRGKLCFDDVDGHVVAKLSHEFRAADGPASYEVDLGFGGGSPLAPALEYRARLGAAKKFVPLSDKIARNPDVARLEGAVHMYVWGDGRSPAFVGDLVKLGVSAAWIGYDQDEFSDQAQAGPAFVAAARAAGFLVGPYDTFGNAQDPKTGDAASRWPGDLFRAGCIVDRDGKIVGGFADRGCELSSEALARADRTALKPLSARMTKSLRDGANSYFVDVDAFGQLHDDFSPAHPMTVFKDRENRIARLTMARDRGVVLGSEEGVGWSVPFIDFAHGAFATHNETLWKEHKSFGKWWPPERPGVFFQPVEASAEFRAAKYDPAYRLPLYEAAFHDSVVATDRWEVPLGKFQSLMPVREVLELLYGVPSIWAMDRRQLAESADEFVRLNRFFAPLHRRIATRALQSFEWLTTDRRVQRTRFDGIVLTANFRDEPFEGLPPGCIEMRAPEAGAAAQRFCPIVRAASKARN